MIEPNGEVLRFDHPVLEHEYRSRGFVRDPDNPDPCAVVEQFPPCPHRSKKRKRCCTGTLMKEYCEQFHVFLIHQCIRCGVLQEIR